MLNRTTSKRLYWSLLGIHPQAMAQSTKDSSALALQYTASSFLRLLFSHMTEAPMGKRLRASHFSPRFCLPTSGAQSQAPPQVVVHAMVQNAVRKSALCIVPATHL